MNKRVAEIRRHTGLNQTDFAKKLGFTQANLSAIELEKIPLTESNIRLICLTFGVSETWLRDGEGEMFTSDDPDADAFLAIYRALSPPFRKMFLEYGRFLIEQQALMPPS
jgi:transcriptional regulator with XRE-family HTH domain